MVARDAANARGMRAARPWSSRLWIWGPAIAWMAVLFVLSSFSDLPDGPEGLTDKHAHSTAYAVLGGLLLRALSGASWAGVTWGRVLAAIALATLYGVTDELHQRFVPGRDASVADLVADAVGAALSTVVAGAWAIIRPRR